MKSIKSIVLYFYPAQQCKYRALSHASIWVGDEIVGYVRPELHNEDALRARDKAKPRKNEIVLNAVDLTE